MSLAKAQRREGLENQEKISLSARWRPFDTVQGMPGGKKFLDFDLSNISDGRI
jgi:hypothetical protein